MVEAGDHHFLRHFGRGCDSGVGESLHLDRIAACERSRDLGAGRRRVAGYSVRFRCRKFQRLLFGTDDGRADGRRLLHEHHGAGSFDSGASGICFRVGSVWIFRHGTGDHRSGFLRAGDGQRTISLRAFLDRADSGRSARDQARLRSRRQL